MICASWGDWRHGASWLLEVLEAAEQEARERGQARVAPAHLAAALTRSPAARAVLDELGVDPRRWRDRIIYTLGVNNGIHFQLQGEAIRRLAHQGELVVEDSSLRVLELAAHEAVESSTELAPAHLIVAFVDRQRGDIATGTAKAEGITLAAARRSAGIPHERRVVAEGNPPSLRRPQRNGPLVLLGGGDTSPEVFRYAIELASARRGASHGPVNVACVFASDPGRPQQNRDRRLAQFRLRNDVTAADCHLDNRNDAADPAVLTALAQADIIFMDGGKPELLYDTIAGTPVMAALIDASDNGAVMMGASAGSVIWGIGLHERLGVGRPARTLPPAELALGRRRPGPLRPRGRTGPAPAHAGRRGAGGPGSAARRRRSRASRLGTLAQHRSRREPLLRDPPTGRTRGRVGTAAPAPSR